MLPFGWSTVCVAMTLLHVRRGSRPTPASATGSTCTRTAGCCPPPTLTWPTPFTCEIFCARTVLADSKTSLSGSVSRRQRQDEDRRVGRVDLAVGGARRQVGRQLGRRGGDGRLDVARGAVDVAVEVELERDVGRAERARRGDLGDPRDAAEAALERRRTDDAIVSGLAPGRLALTWMVGMSTRGIGRDRQQRVRPAPGKQQRRGEQRRGDRPPDERARRCSRDLRSARRCGRPPPTLPAREASARGAPCTGRRPASCRA